MTLSRTLLDEIAYLQAEERALHEPEERLRLYADQQLDQSLESACNADQKPETRRTFII